jgi:hypothetical protein
VVAIEPQPDFLAVLRFLYRRDPSVVLESCAVGAACGESTLFISSRTPTLSTLARSWMGDVRRDHRFLD